MIYLFDLCPHVKNPAYFFCPDELSRALVKNPHGTPRNFSFFDTTFLFTLQNLKLKLNQK